METLELVKGPDIKIITMLLIILNKSKNDCENHQYMYSSLQQIFYYVSKIEKKKCVLLFNMAFTMVKKQLISSS